MLIDCQSTPFRDNDLMHIALLDFDLREDVEFDDYTNFKLNKFEQKDISPRGIEEFKNRPSFQNDKIKLFRNTIYTSTVERENYIEYEKALQQIKTLLQLNSRRAMIRFANSLEHYFNSTVYNDVDATCLSLIHYIRNDKELNVRLVFRALDLENEALTDLITIYTFFIEPIRLEKEKVNIDIIASTTQNSNCFSDYLQKIEKLCPQNS